MEVPLSGLELSSEIEARDPPLFRLRGRLAAGGARSSADEAWTPSRCSALGAASAAKRSAVLRKQEAILEAEFQAASMEVASIPSN